MERVGYGTTTLSGPLGGGEKSGAWELRSNRLLSSPCRLRRTETELTSAVEAHLKEALPVYVFCVDATLAPTMSYDCRISWIVRALRSARNQSDIYFIAP